MMMMMMMMMSSVIFRASTELMLTVIQARDLERDHVTGSLDSYIRVSLAPFTGSRSQTRVRKSTLRHFAARFCFNTDGQTPGRASRL